MNSFASFLSISVIGSLALGAVQAQNVDAGGGSAKPAASEPVVQTVNSLESEMIGRIDWDQKVVYAVGDGVPPTDAVNPAQARVRAKRAAIDEAMARLLETVQEVKVDAESTTRNFINENRIVQARVSGLIKNAVIVEQRQASDGSYQIMMSMPLIGPEGLNASLLPTQIVRIQQAKIVSRTTATDPSPSPPAPNATSLSEPVTAKPESALTPVVDTASSAPATSKTAPHTGLIVDARGLNLSPAAFPKLLSHAGDVLYDLTAVDPNAATERGMCDYRKSMENARQPARAGLNPLVVKAVAASGTNKTDLVLGEATAKQVKTAASVADFLRNAQVVLVVD